MGILYCKAGQSSEEEMYNNEEAGPAFEEFLSLIGEKVCLKGFTKYAAQLDVKSKWRGGLTLRGGRLDHGGATTACPPRGQSHRARWYLGKDAGQWELSASTDRDADSVTTLENSRAYSSKVCSCTTSGGQQSRSQMHPLRTQAHMRWEMRIRDQRGPVCTGRIVFRAAQCCVTVTAMTGVAGVILDKGGMLVGEHGQ